MQKKEKIYLNNEDVTKLKAELQLLVSKDRKKIIEEIKEARKQGDLSENAEYNVAKQKQSIIENRIQVIQSILKNAIIIDKKDYKDLKAIKIGSTVKFLNLSENKEFQIKIGTISELNVHKNIISHRSPLAKSLLGHKVNDEVTIKGIRNTYKVRILEVLSNLQI